MTTFCRLLTFFIPRHPFNLFKIRFLWTWCCCPAREVFRCPEGLFPYLWSLVTLKRCYITNRTQNGAQTDITWSAQSIWWQSNRGRVAGFGTTKTNYFLWVADLGLTWHIATSNNCMQEKLYWSQRPPSSRSRSSANCVYVINSSAWQLIPLVSCCFMECVIVVALIIQGIHTDVTDGIQFVAIANVCDVLAHKDWYNKQYGILENLNKMLTNQQFSSNHCQCQREW